MSRALDISFEAEIIFYFCLYFKKALENHKKIDNPVKKHVKTCIAYMSQVIFFQTDRIKLILEQLRNQPTGKTTKFRPKF